MEKPPEKVIPDIVDCLLKLFSPNDLFDKILKIVGDQRLEAEKRGIAKYYFGLEMEKRDYRDLALDLYEEAEKDIPDDPELQKRIETLRSRLSSGSKYDFLLRQQMVTTEQLQKAASLSKQTRKSVEAVLIENFGIKKEDIGKSFAQFYGCIFHSYEESLATPYELLGNLKKSFFAA